LRWRRYESYANAKNGRDRIEVSTLGRGAQRRLKPVSLTVGMIQGGVFCSGVMGSEMTVNDSPVIRIANVSGVQVLWWEQQQPGDRE
jgi:hypothetical protein